PQLAGLRVEVFRQKAQRAAAGQQALEHLARFVPAADRRQRIDEPERANVESGTRAPEIVLCRVARQMSVAPQLAPDRIDRADEALIVGRKKADLVKQQQAGIDILAAE